ncbi:hypothetical protein E4U23_000897 [Claviceps purpurea]|nr:hypothetical protein E4U23_000897 [Claviceps purpurea]
MFTVRRSVVQAWLDFLRQHHPKYADIEIDHAALAALPDDGDVMHDLPTQIEEQREPEPGQAPDVGPDHARREGETPDIRPTQAFGGFSQRVPGFGPESEDDDGEFGDSSGRGPGTDSEKNLKILTTSSDLDKDLKILMASTDSEKILRDENLILVLRTRTTSTNLET